MTDKKLTIAQQAFITGGKAIRGRYFDQDTFLGAKFVDDALESFPYGTFKTPMNDQGGDTVYKYNEEKGIFENTGVPWIEQQLERILGEKCKKHYYGEVKKHLQVKTYIEPIQFQPNPDVMVLQNGTLNIFTGELMPHSPEYNAREALPLTYDPEAACPRNMNFLEQVMTKDYVTFWQEWLGYHLYKTYIWQRVVLLVGDGDNGKSTLLNVMINFLGKQNISQETLYRLSTNRFSPAELMDKLANIAADIGPQEIRHTGILKMLSGNDWISVERKNRDPTALKNYAKLTFSCNQLPQTPDETLAFYKRFIPIIFERIIPLKDQDSKLLEKLTTEKELSGLLNWALEGLHRALERGRLYEPLTIQERKTRYEEMSDPVTGFYNTYIEEDPQGFEIKQDVIDAFYQYCKKKSFISPSNRTFIERFKKIAYVREYYPKLWTDEHPKGKQIHSWRGIKLSDACRKTQHWTTKEAYITARGTQKHLDQKENIASDIQNMQDMQNMQDSLPLPMEDSPSKGRETILHMVNMPHISSDIGGNVSEKRIVEAEHGEPSPDDPRIMEIAEYIGRNSGKYTTDQVAYRFGGIPGPIFSRLLASAEELGLISRDGDGRWHKA